MGRSVLKRREPYDVSTFFTRGLTVSQTEHEYCQAPSLVFWQGGMKNSGYLLQKCTVIHATLVDVWTLRPGADLKQLLHLIWSILTLGRLEQMSKTSFQLHIKNDDALLVIHGEFFLQISGSQGWRIQFVGEVLREYRRQPMPRSLMVECPASHS